MVFIQVEHDGRRIESYEENPVFTPGEGLFTGTFAI